MKKIKILFLIHDLGQGGAEKVLINLVNNMDGNKFDITVMSLFGGGVNEQFLKKDIRYITVFKKMIPGNSKLMKLFTPKQLHRMFIKDKYDIEISYLEGPAARIISGAKSITMDQRLVSWIHVEQKTRFCSTSAFRTGTEADKCYENFDKIVCVSQTVKEDFQTLFPTVNDPVVLYNSVESDLIRKQSLEQIENVTFNDNDFNIVSVGTLKEVKGFDRLLRVVKRLRDDGKSVHLYILGKGPDEDKLQKQINDNGMEEYAKLLGYHTNPYKYVKNSTLFVCSSYREGFSTAATEALIVGTPVCTVDVSGMKEMLGENNEYGIVTENNEDALYEGIKRFIDDRELLLHYKKQAEIRGRSFSTEETVKAVEEMLKEVYENG